MLPHLRKSINQAHLENGTYEQIVKHLERDLELIGLEAPDELQINTVSQHSTNTNTDRAKPTCRKFQKKTRQYRNQCRLIKKQKEQSEDTQNNAENKSSGANNSFPNNNTNNNNNNYYKNCNKAEKSQKMFIQPVKHVERQTSPQ